MPLTAGSRLGPYGVLSSLGAGGMGEVYRAQDWKLNRDVAIKVLPETFTHDRERLLRFDREAKTISQISYLRASSDLKRPAARPLRQAPPRLARYRVGGPATARLAQPPREARISSSLRATIVRR